MTTDEEQDVNDFVGTVTVPPEQIVADNSKSAIVYVFPYFQNLPFDSDESPSQLDGIIRHYVLQLIEQFNKAGYDIEDDLFKCDMTVIAVLMTSMLKRSKGINDQFQVELDRILLKYFNTTDEEDDE